MTLDSQNPLGMVPDPYAGDHFIFPETLSTDQGRLWLRRANEIIGFLTISELALRESMTKYEQLQRKLNPDTPLKLESSDGRVVVMPVHRFLKQCADGVDVLCRQVFVMLYGSLETYLFELLERSFPKVGITEDLLDRSLEIMMKRKWDGKLCKMRDVFGLKYQASDLISHFHGFEINIEGRICKNPIDGLDELAQIRHKIVHASSILEKGGLIFIDAKIFHAYYAFLAKLVDYVDGLFSRRFDYPRIKINPGEA